MASTLKSDIRPTVVWEYRNALDLSTVIDDESRSFRNALANGTGENQANIMWHDRRLVTAATPDDVLNLDLAGGLTDVFGTTLTFVKIKAMLFINRGIPDGNGGWTTVLGADLLIGGASANQFDTFVNTSGTAKIVVPSGGALLMSAPVDGWAVVAGTGDILLMSHSGLRGPQLIVNGNFDTGDLTGWTDVDAGTGESTYDSGTMKLVSGAAIPTDAAARSHAAEITGFIVGRTYVLSGDVTVNGLRIQDINLGVGILDWEVGANVANFTAIATVSEADGLLVNNNDNNETANLDNISLREQALGDLEYDIVLIGTDA